MQVGEQGLAMPHTRVLDWRRLLDLEYQVGVPPHALCGVDQFRACGLELRVGDRRALTRARLDQNLMTTTGQLGDAGRSDRHAEFVVFRLGWDADMHTCNCEESSAIVQRRRRHMFRISKWSKKLRNTRIVSGCQRRIFGQRIWTVRTAKS